jgi:hypothetical protein
VSDELRERYPYHRRFIRQKVRVRIDVDGHESHSSWTINLSPDGLCFELPRPVAPDEEVGVSVFLSRDKRARPVRAAARVVWSERAGSGHRHGARFVRFDDGDEERLFAWLGRPAGG